MYAKDSVDLLLGDAKHDTMQDFVDTLTGVASSPWTEVTNAAPTPVALRRAKTITPGGTLETGQFIEAYHNTDPLEGIRMTLFSTTYDVAIYIADNEFGLSNRFGMHTLENSTVSNATNGLDIYGPTIAADEAGPITFWVHGKFLLYTHKRVDLGAVIGGGWVWLGPTLDGMAQSQIARSQGTLACGGMGYYSGISDLPFNGAWADSSLYTHWKDYLPGTTTQVDAQGRELVSKVWATSFGPNRPSFVSDYCPYLRSMRPGAGTIGDVRTIDGVDYECFLVRDDSANIFDRSWWVAAEDIE